MTAIWQNDGEGWRLLAPSGFPAEAALHKLVEQAPHMLPLAGSPRLIILGREVLLGGTYADLIAVEPSGRLAVIEIKLAQNAEARRAIIAQILTYAAFLRGLDPDRFERDVLASHLHQRGYESLRHAAESNDQEGSFDPEEFATELANSLRTGRFRLVLVLDQAPPELVRLVGYLEAVTDQLVIDLVTVAAYQIGDSQVMVPQRVDPEREPERLPAEAPAAKLTKGYATEGAEDFIETIDKAPTEAQETLRRLAEWAKSLDQDGLARLWTYHGVSGGLWTLLPYIPGVDAGLVTLYNDGGVYVQFWRSVFLYSAPSSLPRVEQLVAPSKVGQGTTTRAISEKLLNTLTDAYREAATSSFQVKPVKEDAAK